jgi:formate dehydrogenase maturation protein FdhE
MDEFSSIGFCPVCCSNVDIVVPPSETEDDVHEFECANCGQKWTMHVDPDRFAQHSIA